MPDLYDANRGPLDVSIDRYGYRSEDFPTLCIQAVGEVDEKEAERWDRWGIGIAGGKYIFGNYDLTTAHALARRLAEREVSADDEIEQELPNVYREHRQAIQALIFDDTIARKSGGRFRRGQFIT